jgi:predicted ATPase/class 3 adenylate cyclase
MGEAVFGGGGAPSLLIVLFTDIVGSTELTARLGDEQARSIRDAHDAIVREQLHAHGGREVQTTGDGFLVTFRSVRDAIACASAIQRAQAEHNRRHPNQALSFRAGLNAGEVSPRDDGLFGSAVNMASRVMARAGPGQILVSEVVRRLAGGLSGVEFQDRGRVRLKGFPDRWRLYEVIWGEAARPAGSLTADRSRDQPQTAPRRRLATRPPGTNLPGELTPLVGRGEQLVRLRSLLTRDRLVSLVGPGGTGKTRLALAVAARVHRRFRAGVRFVELAPVTRPELLAHTVAQALEIEEDGRSDATARIAAEIGQGRWLIVLDNCEHVLDEAASLCDALLRRCAWLAVLVTSRERLGLSGEVVWPVPPMELPDPGQVPTPAKLSGVESVQLFCDRARRVRPTFVMDAENAGAIAELVRRLDGLPLAIELAAAWSELFSPRDLLGQLDDRFRLLTSRDRIVSVRHASLRAAIDWSYDSLEPRRQWAFRSLGLFAGGFTLESVAAVCEIPVEEAAGLLAGLVDRSLVSPPDLSARPARYRMLDSLREYALEQSRRSPDYERRRRAFAGFFIGLAQRAQEHLQGSGGAAWLAVLDAERDNCQLAMEAALESEPKAALRLAAALGPYWDFRGRYQEARLLLSAVVGRPGERSVELAAALRHLALAEWAQGDQAQAIRHSRRALGVSVRLDDGPGTVLALQQLGQICFEVGDLAASRSHLDAALDKARSIGDQPLLSVCLFRLGVIALVERRWSEARDLFTSSLQHARAVDQLEAQAITSVALGILHLNTGQPEAAAAALGDSLSAWGERGTPRQLALILQCLGAVAAARGDPERAARLAGAAARIRDTTGVRPTSPLQRELEARLGGVLEAPELADAVAEGRAMDEAAALRYAREESA